MQVSYFTSLARRISGASRAYGRFRGAEDIDKRSGPLRFYDRNVPQSRSVGAMLNLMRRRGFLDLQHRGSEWVTNVFCDPSKRMERKEDQQRLLQINEHGKKQLPCTLLSSSLKSLVSLLRRIGRNILVVRSLRNGRLSEEFRRQGTSWSRGRF